MKFEIAYTQNGEKKVEKFDIETDSPHRYAVDYVKNFNATKTPQEYKKELVGVKITNLKNKSDTKKTKKPTKKKDSTKKK